MAFINGTITRYECPLCGIGCRPKLIGSVPGHSKFVYAHADGVVMDVNGYPGICENAGKELSGDEINIVHSPNIIRDRTNFWSTN